LKELWVPLSGAIAQQKNVEAIANNVANVNTPGFKKDQLVFKEYLTNFEKKTLPIDLPNKEWSPENFYQSNGSEHAFVQTDGNYTDFEQGQLSPTYNPLDLAIQGTGFFEVKTENGIRYTRDGRFSLSSDGYLVSKEGHKVLSDSQEAIEEIDFTDDKNLEKKIPNIEDRYIRISPGQISVNNEGRIYINNDQIKKISIVEFNDKHSLAKEGHSLFINKDKENLNTQITNSKVQQGFIEESNVNPIIEMSALIKANRHFESLQRILKTYDQIAEKSSNEISKF
jgi:flagellar basal-body rod protein FlgG